MRTDHLIDIEWHPTHAFHANVNVFVATASEHESFGVLQPVSFDKQEHKETRRVGKTSIPENTARIVWYVCTDYEKSDDGVAISGCQVGSNSMKLKKMATGTAKVRHAPMCCNILCTTTTTQFVQGVLKIHTNEFVEGSNGASSQTKLTNFNEFVSKELHCFGLQNYCKYDVPLMCVVDQTSCDPIGTVDQMYIRDDNVTVFSMVGQDGAHSLEEWNEYTNKELGLYKHPIVFSPSVPIVSRIHLTEWTPLNKSLPAALFFSQFDDAAELQEPHLVATLEIALERNGMTVDEFVDAVSCQLESEHLLREFNKAVTVCAESATVLPNAFEYRTDATRDKSGKLIMMDKMERLNGWVHRTYGDCEDMAAYMTQHLHTLRECKDFKDPLTIAAHTLMQEFMPLAVLGGVTYVGSGGAKLADNEYKPTDDMYKDGNAAHMWTMLMPHADIMHMLGEDTSGYRDWQKRLRLRVCEGTSRMSPNIVAAPTVRPSIKSLHSQHMQSRVLDKRKVVSALQRSGIRNVQHKAETELHPSDGHSFYKRPTHVFTPSLQSHPKYQNWMQFVFCEENEHDILYSLPFSDIIHKRPNCKLMPVPVCGNSIKQSYKEMIREMPCSEAMCARGRAYGTTRLEHMPTHCSNVSADVHTHTVWVRGDMRAKSNDILKHLTQNMSNKHVLLDSCCESIGVDAPTTTCFKITLSDAI